MKNIVLHLFRDFIKCCVILYDKDGKMRDIFLYGCPNKKRQHASIKWHGAACGVNQPLGRAAMWWKTGSKPWPCLRWRGRGMWRRADRARPSWWKGKTFDRRHNMEMKMDHARDSAVIVPKGQNMICFSKGYLSSAAKHLSVTFLQWQKIPKQLDGCLIMTAKCAWKVFKPSVCLSPEWSSGNAHCQRGLQEFK